MNDSFDIFIEKKRIDLKAFRAARKAFSAELEELYNRVGPNSFDQQKKFLFNPLRLDFPLDTPIVEPTKPAKTKPVKKKPLLRKKPLLTGEKTEEGEKKKAIPLKRPLMKPKTKTKEATSETPAKSPPPLKRPIMKKPLMNKAEDKKEEPPRAKLKPPPLKRPIMKPKKPDQSGGQSD